MKEGYAEVFRSETSARKYDEVVYAAGSRDSLINEREETWLRQLVSVKFPERQPVQHDFACGTGRAIRSLAGLVAAAYGYDTSSEMISRMQESQLQAEFAVVPDDGTVAEPLASGTPAIVTMFRLFLNVGDEVRNVAMAFAAKVLQTAESGLLVVENHGNRRSLRHLLKWHNRDDDWFNEFSHNEMKRLLAQHGFELRSIHGFGILPQAAYRLEWTRPVARRIDAWASRAPWLASLHVCVVYVAQRQS